MLEPIREMQHHWNEAVQSLRGQLGEHYFNLWIAPLAPLREDSGTLTVGAPSEFAAGWVRSHYAKPLTDALRSRVGRPVDLIIDLLPEQPSPARNPPERAASPAPVVPPPANAPEERYTFENFIEGPNNQFALGAARYVADKPGMRWTPLFIHGPVGLGKTHLLHAIAGYSARKFPGKRIRYVTAEEFINEYIQASQNGGMEAFRHKYRRQTDILLLDDIEMIRGKPHSQEEFFHTFNSLYGERKQIVLTSDRAPKDLDGLEDRLRSRFQQGLQVDIRPPDRATREAILRAKASSMGLPLEDDVVDCLAAGVTGNVRELEAALVALDAHVSLTGQPATLETAESILHRTIHLDGPVLTFALIMDTVATHYGVRSQDLRGKSRRREVVLPRQMAMHLCRTLLHASFPGIAAQFGGKDHTTVLSACRKMEKMLEQDETLRQSERMIRKTLGVEEN
ncbi:MAG: Chromosomal replication initiator protein DnaA [Myxococcota bacterium]|nr:Chromosomal replication initiator protein DnaA [Myxococcota bacterium]